MKKLIVSIISIVLVASLLSVAIFAINSIGSPKDITELSEMEQLLASTKGENGHFTTASLSYKEVFSDFSPENLDAIMAAFDKIIDENETVDIACTITTYMIFLAYEMEMPEELAKLNPDPRYGVYTEHDTKYAEIAEVSTDGLSTDMQRNALKYAMLISVYVICFPENTCYYAPYEMKDSIVQCAYSMNCDIVVSFDYADYGYGDALTYHRDARAKKVEFGRNTYTFSAREIDVYSIVEYNEISLNDVPNDSQTNLLERYNPDCIRVRFQKGIHLVPAEEEK